MKNLIIYHRIDFDGLCSMAIIRERLEMIKGNQVDIIGYMHEDAKPVISDDYISVTVVDVCLDSKTMKQLNKERRLVWIDHHATSIADSVRDGFDTAPGLRREGVGACELCFEFLHPGENMPLFVQLLSAYDVWDKKRFDWDKQTLPFQYGMRDIYNLDTEKFYDLYKTLREPCNKEVVDDILNDITKTGSVIIHYTRSHGRRACESYAFEALLAGKVRALCMLTAHFGAMEMEETMRERGCQVAVCINRSKDNGGYKVSIYAGENDPGINIGEYMKEHYRGGGHRKAAGGKLTQKQFLRLMNKRIL